MYIYAYSLVNYTRNEYFTK